MLILWLLSLTARAQGWSALAMSNYGGLNAQYVNPSVLADSPYRWYVNAGAANWSLYNNFVDLRGPYSLWDLVSGKVPSTALNGDFGGFFSDPYFVTNFDGKPKYANLAGELRLPGVAFTWKNHGVAFSNRVRVFMQLNHFSEALARLARYGTEELDSVQIAQQLLGDQRFSFNVGAWHEFAGTHAWTLTPGSARHYWKVGFTGKYLVGFGAGYINSENSPLPLDRAIPITINTQKISYVYTNPAYYQQPGFRTRDLYNRNRMGQGVGLDVGVTYEFRPGQRWDADGDDARLSNYRWRVGLAITDLGRIHYQKPRAMRGLQLKPIIAPNTKNLDTISWHGFPAVDAVTSRVFGVEEALYSIDARLPTTLNLTVDRCLLPNVYVGMLWQQGLVSRYAIGIRTFSSLTVSPRFEHRQIEIAVPLRLANDYRTFRPGLMLRVGPAFFGTDDLGGFMADREMRGFDMYFGAAYVVGRPKVHHRRRPRVLLVDEEVGLPQK